MKMRKLLLTCAAVASVSLAFSVSAFAETSHTMLHNAASATVPAGANGQMTVMVIDMGDATTIPTPDATNILYIDQVPNSADIFQYMKLKDKVEPGKYYGIKVGGENLASATEEIFKVGALVEGEEVNGYKTFLASAPIKVNKPANMKFKITKTNTGEKEAIIGSFASNITTTQEVIPVVQYKISDNTRNPVKPGDTFTVTLYDNAPDSANLTGAIEVDAWTYIVPNAAQ